MRTKLYSSFLAAFSILMAFSSCTAFGSIRPSSTTSTRDYQVKEFNKIEASTVGNLIYTQSKDGSTSLQISGPDNILELIQVKVKDHTLYLSLKKSNIKNIKNLDIKVSSPDLAAIDFRGVGNVSIPEGLTTSALTLYSKGVGEVNLAHLKCDEVNVFCSGVGNINLKGSSTVANYESKGVGNVDASGLEAERVTASSSGIGNIDCKASETLVATSRGIGNITYRGNAKADINKKGIGEVKHL